MQELLNSGNALPPNVAYYKWDEERNCTEIWKQYFVMNYKNYLYQHDSAKYDYINAINQCLKQFSEPISKNEDNKDFAIDRLEIEARGKNDAIVVRFVDGRSIPFDLLPQGYKRILSIAFDLAHRSYLLNKNCNPHGMVFIDEIELHLHPSLAQEVLTRLQTVFPSIQFVITTHSPLVIADYKQDKENILYKLTRNETESTYTKLQNLYGMDFISVLRNIMDTPERDSFLINLLGAFKYWKTVGDISRMNQIAEAIKKHVGEDNLFYLKTINQ